MKAGGALGLALVFSWGLIGPCGCTPQRDRMLPVPMPLATQGEFVFAYGELLPTQDADCDPSASGTPGMAQPLLLDTGTPLPAFLGDPGLPTLSYPDGQVVVRAGAGGVAGRPGLLMCDVPLLQTGQTRDAWTLRWGGTQMEPAVQLTPAAILGGDLMTRYSTTWLFARTELCAEPPCVSFSTSDIASICALADRDQAVLPFSLLGGNGQSVQVGDDVLVLPPTRITLSACLEPLGDPLAGAQPIACMNGGQRDPHYGATGVDVRLLVSTVLPGLILSRTAYGRLRGEDKADQLFGQSTMLTMQVPGFSEEPVFQSLSEPMLGRQDVAALVLVSRERFLSPCAELARSRRQRYALPQLQGAAQTPPPPAVMGCLVDLGQDQQRCAYGGQNPELACDDSQAPVAALVELDDPLPVYVVADTAEVLQSVNADLRNTSPQVDGIIGLSVLSRLEAEIDAPGGRFVARCGCDNQQACRAYRRFTDQAIDSCSPDDALSVPPSLGLISTAPCQAAR